MQAVFGVKAAVLRGGKGADKTMVSIARQRMAETVRELGASQKVFFLLDWAELSELPRLVRMLPDRSPPSQRLAALGANQYRAFRFEPSGAIKAALVFLRLDDHLTAQPAKDLALIQAALVICPWSAKTIADNPPLTDTAGLIRAGSAPALPVVARDSSHPLRITARLRAS